MMKRFVWVAVLLISVAVLYYLTRPPQSSESTRVPPSPHWSEVAPKISVPQTSSPETASAPPAPATNAAPPQPEAPPLPTPAEGARPLAQRPEEEMAGPADELENVQFMIRDYRDALGENPVGNNAEITKALMGDNARQVKMAVPAGSQLNAQGELSDRWGTPYFFHQLSGTEMEIRSAGPDQKMWTGDDLLTR